MPDQTEMVRQAYTNPEIEGISTDARNSGIVRALTFLFLNRIEQHERATGAGSAPC